MTGHNDGIYLEQWNDKETVIVKSHNNLKFIGLEGLDVAIKDSSWENVLWLLATHVSVT